MKGHHPQRHFLWFLFLCWNSLRVGKLWWKHVCIACQMSALSCTPCTFFFFLLNICIPTCLVWCRKLWLPKPTALSAIGWLPLMMEIGPLATTPQSKFDTQEGVFSYWGERCVCVGVCDIFKHAWVDFNTLLLKLSVLRKSCNLNFYFIWCAKCTFLF